MENTNRKETMTKKIKSKEAERKLKQILEICKANAVYDWDSNMENNPQDEFKAIAEIIKE